MYLRSIPLWSLECHLSSGQYTMTEAKDVTESAFVFIHPSLHEPPRATKVSG
jgi:hypothetical protein